MAVSQTPNLVFGDQFPGETGSTALHNAPLLVSSLTLIAPSINVDKVKVGGASVGTDGVRGMDPGTSFSFAVRQGFNLTEIFVKVTTVGDGIIFVAGRG